MFINQLLQMACHLKNNDLGMSLNMSKKAKKLINQIVKVLGSRIIYTLVSIAIVALGSYFAIQYARGNWRVTNKGIVANTGLLSVNSFPTGAQVFIDDKLITATDDTTYLEPGIYQIKIVKEGYSPWNKLLNVQSELVTQTNAVLFPSAPSITPLTFTGVDNINPSPDGQKILFFTNQASSKLKNGFFVLDLNSNFLSLQSGPKQVTDDLEDLDLINAKIIWSPDSTEFMILSDSKEFLISTDKKVVLSEQKDISFQKKDILAQWEEEIYLRERQFLAKFPIEVSDLTKNSAKNAYLSPDKKRLLYTATAASTLAEDIVPPVPATNTQAEARTLEPGAIYVYDREEDKNFKIATVAALPNLLLNSGEATDSASKTEASEETKIDTEKITLADDLDQSIAKSLEASPTAFNRLQRADNLHTALSFANYYTAAKLNTMQWFPDSKHLLFVEDGKIKIMEYDGQNVTTVYSGPFANDFVYPWPDGSKLIIKTSFSPDSPDNLYVIDLK
ncbi:MAG: PEGA domain protein [Candidatus Pacebacteria bacterium GW2011_GWF2_38_9]|nr:MAG: hypothetical protein US01_C0001G0888 [candidate division TM6 bacterium GW2011_GWF2_28_16]KKQ09459.1 MAG: PEGA domain protein [Candidatus Pacebacteria bacterium GW2011_GWF1_36_5]KKQ89202.1 MAG: PEGA domain protein [Candidatus Pacebacteria bacterium GW2011_GWF2_38_9]HAZ73773.1 hypothetical protein [Candidatus Paceibacterota bacterium]